jgi:hypothetical protein
MGGAGFRNKLVGIDMFIKIKKWPSLGELNGL